MRAHIQNYLHSFMKTKITILKISSLDWTRCRMNIIIVFKTQVSIMIPQVDIMSYELFVELA